MSQKNTYLAASTFTLLLIMFIDGIGMSLVLPLIGELFTPGVHSMLSSSTPYWLSQVYYGGSLACFSGAMIIGAVVLGQLSDRHGRKWTLYLALIGAIVGYLLCAYAVYIQTPWLFLTGRIIDGLTAGSIPVAQAMLADLDNRQNKMTSIAKVMFAVTSGYMVGPMLASVSFFAQTEFYLPFLLVALFCIFSMVLLSKMPDSFIPQQVKKLDLMVAFRQIKTLLKTKPLQKGLIGFFLFQCVWTFFYQYLPIMTFAKAHIGLLMTEVGIGMCFAFCVLVPKLQNKKTSQQLIMYCVALFSLVLVMFVVLPLQAIHIQLLSVCMAILYAVGYSAMLAYLLSISNDDQKGLIFGSIASICAISATVTALLGGTLVHEDEAFFFTVLLLACLMVLFLFIKNIKNRLIEQNCS